MLSYPLNVAGKGHSSPTIPLLRRNPASFVNAPNFQLSATSSPIPPVNNNGQLSASPYLRSASTPGEGQAIEMQRTNSFRRDAEGEREPNAGTEERDTLLSRSATPDLEAAGRSSRKGSLLPSFARGGTRANGKKRRDSNENIFLDTRRGSARTEREQQRRLCIAITLIIIPLTFVFLLFTHTFHIPWIHDRSDDTPPTTNPPGSHGDGPQHVPIPIKGPFKLPPPTDVPRNDAFWTEGEKGVVASEDETCSKMGVDILKAGGNAVVSPHVRARKRYQPTRRLSIHLFP